MTETRSSDNKYLQGINLVEEYEAVSVCQTNARVLGKTVKWIYSVQKVRLGGLMVVKEQTWKGGRGGGGFMALEVQTATNEKRFLISLC